MDELYLDNIDEYVNDHNKIVTYKWLSLTLGVHVNTAKQMLYHYLDHKRKETSARLNATYLVSGKFVDNGQTSHRVSVVKEDQLEDFKSKMSLIVSVHVYSVQKALLKDSGPLYSVDYDAVKDNLQNCSKFSAIHCASAVPMSSVESQQRETHRASTPEPEHKKPSMNGQANAAPKASAKPKGIMGLFAEKQAPKTQETSKVLKREQKEHAAVVDPPKSKPAVKSNPMANYFSALAAKKPDKTLDEAKTAPTSSSSSSSSAAQQQSKPEDKKEAAAEPPKDKQTESRSKTKRVEDSDSEEEKMEKKKRRRIKRPEPDSSDEDVIPDSPQQVEEREPSPGPQEEFSSVSQSHEDAEVKTTTTTVTTTTTTIRRRRRVLRSRNTIDDEGCMVTEKFYESESYSETEDDFKPAKQAPKDLFPGRPAAGNKQDEKKSQKKPSSNANKGTKQASIKGFFPKK